MNTLQSGQDDNNHIFASVIVTGIELMAVY